MYDKTSENSAKRGHTKMFIFDISGPWVLYYSFYLPSVKTPKMAANPLKKAEIPREMTEVPAFRAFFQRNG